MPVIHQAQTTSRFVDPWPYLACGTAVLLILAFVSSLFFQKNLKSVEVQASEEEPVELEPVQLSPRPVGALRIDVKASIPDNRWVTYEIQLRDQQDKILMTAIKQAWRESGTWQEEGESGTWQEDDLQGGLDIRAAEQKQEWLKIAIAVLEYTDTAGQDVDQPVPFEVSVRSGVVDTRYLWAGFVGTVSLAALSLKAVGTGGTKVIAKTIGDSDVGARATVGGRRKLLRVTVRVTADKNTPHHLTAYLRITNGNGEQVFSRSFLVACNFRKDDEGRIEKATGQLQVFLIVEPPSSYGFHVEITPDGPVDETQLIVQEGVRTLQAVEVMHIHPA